MSKGDELKKQKKSDLARVRSDFEKSFSELSNIIGSVETASDNLNAAQTLTDYMAEHKHEDAAVMLNTSKYTLINRLKQDNDWRVTMVNGRLRCVLIS